MKSLRCGFAARCARTHNAADEARQINGNIVLAAVLLLLAVLSGSSHGQCIDYDDYPQWVGGVGMPTHTREIAIDGDYAYMTGTFPPGLAVANISNPAAPEVVSFLEMGSWTMNGLAVYQHYVYVANFSDGLQVVDVSNPSAPAIVGNWDGSLNAVTDVIVYSHVYGTFLCVVGWGGLRILDISAPTSPVEVASLDMSIDWYGGLAISSGRLYIANGHNGLAIVNLGWPLSPTLIGSSPTNGVAGDVVVSGDWAYIADGEAGVSAAYIRYGAVPVSWTVDTPGFAQDIAMSGGYLFAADDANGVTAIDPRVGQVGVHSCIVGPGPAVAIAVAGAHVFTTAYDYGLQVADFRSILPVGTVSGLPHSACVQGDIAYLGLYGTGPTYELQVVDVANPVSPIEMGRISVPYFSPEYLTVKDGRAYWVDRSDGLAIMDVSDPYHPALISRMDLRPLIGSSNVPEFVEVVASHAYIPIGSAGVIIVDATSPSSPVQVGVLDTPGTAYTVMEVDNYLYVADATAGLQVVDVSIPASATITRSVTTQGAAGWLDRQGDRLYVTEIIGGMYTYIEIFDISRRTDPVSLGGAYYGGLSSGASIRGHHAYLPLRQSGNLYFTGVAVIDISDYNTPELICEFALPPSAGGADGVAGISENFYYVTSLSQGLCLYTTKCNGVSAADDPERHLGATHGPIVLESTYPNPFNPDVRVRYSNHVAGTMTFQIVDALGRQVFEMRLGYLEAGTHEISWDGRTGSGQRAPSGVYFARLSLGASQSQSAKIVLVE